MRERPEGLALLQVAAAALREQILPVLKDQERYVGHMVLNALSIAERQLTPDPHPLESERALLEALLKQSHDDEELQACVAGLERELARRIREGAYDNDGLGQRVLWQLTLQRVRESAPRYLKAEGIE